MSEAALESLATRSVFRRGFLHETLRRHRDGHAAYYGELVWILMALEVWLDAHHGRTVRAASPDGVESTAQAAPRASGDASAPGRHSGAE